MNQKDEDWRDLEWSKMSKEDKIAHIIYFGMIYGGVFFVFIHMATH